MVTRTTGGYRFMKLTNKKEKNYVFYFAGKRIFYIYL
jgi:hypothetical protein